MIFNNNQVLEIRLILKKHKICFSLQKLIYNKYNKVISKINNN